LPAIAGSPTIQVLSDTFATRAVTPTGATTGSYGPPNSSWGVGNGWYDYIGSNGSVPGTGWNITSAGATCTTKATFAHLFQDPALTTTPNQRIVATTTAVPAAGTAMTYFVGVRGTYNTDEYALVLSITGNQVVIDRLSGGNGTVTTLISSPTVSVATGHVYSLDLTATGDGSTTTTLTGVVKDVTAGTTFATVSNSDTTQELQSGGRVSIGVYDGVSGGSTYSYSSVQIYSDTALSYGSPTYLGFMGDSLTYGLSTTLQTVPDLFSRILNSQTLSQRYVPINMGFSGAKTADWLNSSPTGYMNAFVKNMNALGSKTVFITLGSNDALAGVTAATWLSNMQSIVAYLQAQIPGVTIYFDFPPYFDWVRFNNAFGTGSAASLPLLRTYNYAALVSSGVIIGDTTANQTFADLNYQGLTDGGHPSDQGVPELMFLWLMAYLKNTNQISAGTNSTIIFQGH
jgi:lysophospholipase L1-like esterase